MNTEAASLSPEGLLQAFAATHYRVAIAGHEFVVRLGRRHAALDAALGHRPWSIVTACNPQARQIDDADNQSRHLELLETLAELGLESHPAVNRNPGGDWPDETAALIVGAQLGTLDTLADRFAQLAIVTGCDAGPARLRLYGESWPDPRPEWTEQAG